MEGLHPWWPAMVPIHPHLLFESLGWMLAWRLFLIDRAAHDPVAVPLTRATLLTIGVVGGALGAKGSFLLEDPWTTAQHLGDPAWLLSGRSIVGGLLGAWWSVELGKWWMGVTVATGDAYVRSIGYGLALGRVGCFLSGVSDGTHGVPTDLPWGMDLGDGVPRHPTAMYEILMLLVLVPVVSRLRLPAEGDRFKVFLISYLLWRVAIESIKTQPFVFSGLSGIQVQCLLGLVAYTVVLAPRVFRRSSQVA